MTREKLELIRHKVLFTISLLTLFLLSACAGGGAYSLAYPASGSSGNLLGVTQSESFRRNEDLNIVVKLNDHDGVTVQVDFYEPGNDEADHSLEAEVDGDTGSVLLGLDFEQYVQQFPPEAEIEWPTGTWTAVIFIDGEEVDRVDFTVLS
jgi:hypothetical protein